MEFLTNYKLRALVNGDAVRDRNVKRSRAKIRKHFEADPSAFTVDALEPNQTELVPKRIRVINESVLKQLNPERVYSKYAVPHPDDHIISGTMFFGLYEVDWLVGAETGLGDVHQQIVLQKLNEMISFKNTAGNVIALPAVVNGVSRVGDGVEALNLITIPDELVKIRLQENITTRSIKRGLRVKIANKMYEIMKIDPYTDENVLNIIAREDLIEPGDDFEEPVAPPVENFISGSDTITRARDYTYTAPIADVVSWEIAGATPDIVWIKSSDSTSVVIRAEKTVLISFQLIAHYSDNTQNEKTIRIVSLL